MFDDKYKFTCVERFLRYVKYDTQSDDNATSFPSTEKQKILLKDLAEELKKVGLKDASMDEWGYVIGTLPANIDKKVPTIAFIGHADTSPQVSGENVNPIIRKNYRGGDISLENGLIIKESENLPLKDMVGFDIITTDGKTLLGADDKAGVAEIVDAMNYLNTHPDLKHGAIEVCIAPDEETGRGTEKLDMKKLKAKYAYTVDGSTRGEIETETFSADAVSIKFHGKNIHPGYAKNKMINSVKIAAAFLGSLPDGTLSPETTEGREGYVHCVSVNGTEELTTVKFIIRDFRTEKLKEYESLLEKLARMAVAKVPGSRMDFDITEQYRNMKEILDQHPIVAAYAVEAMKRLDIKTKEHYIRGGTDGARLCFMGLPTPNIFAGSQSYHSPLEFVAVQDMEMAVKTIIEIVKLWEEKS